MNSPEGSRNSRVNGGGRDLGYWELCLYLFIWFNFIFIVVGLWCCVNFCCTAQWPSHAYIYTFSHTTFHHGLSQETGLCSWCCTVGPHCLSILNGWFASTCPKVPIIPLPSPPPWQPHVCSLCLWVRFCSVERFVIPIPSEVSPKEKDKCHTWSLMWNLKYGTDESI